jgi:tetratricopeptide (TPR) repeat protein
MRSQYFEKSNFSSVCPLGDKSGEGTAYNNMGICLRNLGKVQEAIEMYKKTLEIAQQTGEY